MARNDPATGKAILRASLVALLARTSSNLAGFPRRQRSPPW